MELFLFYKIHSCRYKMSEHNVTSRPWSIMNLFVDGIQGSAPGEIMTA